MSARRVALEYYRLIDGFVIDSVDEAAAGGIRACGIEGRGGNDDHAHGGRSGRGLAQVVLDLAQGKQNAAKALFVPRFITPLRFRTR